MKRFLPLAIVNVFLAKWGNIDCVANLIKKSGKEVRGLVTVVELMELKGKSRFDFPVESMHSI